MSDEMYMQDQYESDVPTELMPLDVLIEQHNQAVARERELARALEHRQEMERQAYRQEVVRMCGMLGTTPAQLFGFSQQTPAPEMVVVEKSPKRKSTKVGEPKYRNPANPAQTWTGKGRSPNWIVQAKEMYGDEWEDLCLIKKDESLPIESVF